MLILTLNVFLLFLATPFLNAQTTSTIEGSVSDSQGARVPGVQISVSGQSPAIQRSTVTDSEGLYIFPVLPPGRYILTVSHSGFLTAP
ncbi:MAG: carboxypeptidase-like regulatory domain-containing protein [Pyrinomonadaceae bacterium]